MLETILTIQTEGPKYGYHINPDKGTYLLGRCETSAEAIGRKAALVQLGLNPDIIRIRPDNSPIPVEAAIRYGGKYLVLSSALQITLTPSLEIDCKTCALWEYKLRIFPTSRIDTFFFDSVLVGK